MIMTLILIVVATPRSIPPERLVCVHDHDLGGRSDTPFPSSRTPPRVHEHDDSDGSTDTH